jgi:hypothetical protein
MGLTQEQLDALALPLDASVVKMVPVGGGSSAPYIPGGVIKRRLNEIFGVAGWRFTFIQPPVVTWTGEARDKVACVARAVGRLEIFDEDGSLVTVREDIGHGEAASTPGVPPMEKAEKASATDCLKRCAVSLGTATGLSLYDADDRWGERAAERHANGGKAPRDLQGEKAVLGAKVGDLLREAHSSLTVGKFIRAVCRQVLDADMIADVNQLDAVIEAMEAREYDPHTGEAIPVLASEGGERC